MVMIQRPAFSGIAQVTGADGKKRHQSADEIAQDLTTGKTPVTVVSSQEWNRQIEAAKPGGATALPDAEGDEDWQFLEVKGQEIHSSCGAAALVGAAERQVFQETGKIIRLAIWPTYMLAQMIGDAAGIRPKIFGTDGGVVPSYAVKTACNDGFMPEDLAREHLPDDLIKKWGGDVYPRNYWNGRGSQRQFEAVAAQGYREACAAYMPLLKNESIREAMYKLRMQTVVQAKSFEDVYAAEETRSATAIECHVWGDAMDSHPTHLKAFPGSPPARGAQHGHHATYTAGRSVEKDSTNRKKLIKANSWRPFQALLLAKKLGTQDLDVQEWGDDGLKIWDSSAVYNQMARDKNSWIYLLSNMAIDKAAWRKTDVKKFRLI